MSIPASRVVTINPQVLAVGGSSLALNTLFLTENSLMPVGAVYAFRSKSAVSSFFGPAAAETALAVIYFNGYDNSNVKPSAMLFAPYNAAGRSGWLQSGSLATLSLSQLQALSGTLTINLDGAQETSSNINLAAATSFSNAAGIIAAAFTTSPIVNWNPVNSTFVLTSHTTGLNSSLSYATGTLAEGLKLASDDGGTLSAGAVADTPATAMQSAVNASQNWVSFVTLFEPQLSDKQNFAAWSNGQNQRFLYIPWDTDAQAIVSNSTECFGYVASQLEYNGVADPISGDPATVPAGTTLAAMLLNVATFLGGAIASIDFAATNGRTTLAFRSQSGLAATCASDATSQTLIANGYSYYGSYATANRNFTFFYPGGMPGNFAWIDSFVNQVYMNSQFQLNDLALLTAVGAISYDTAGYGLLRAAKLDTINAAINFGSIRAGVVLSNLQRAEINQAAGVDAATQIQNNGYYLQILDPGPAIRAVRGTPIQNFWYTDGGAVQMLSLASISVQ